MKMELIKIAFYNLSLFGNDLYGLLLFCICLHIYGSGQMLGGGSLLFALSGWVSFSPWAWLRIRGYSRRVESSIRITHAEGGTRLLSVATDVHIPFASEMQLDCIERDLLKFTNRGGK